ncbi:MAG: hypothetical protein KGJ07_08355 [Patescibacteria group bacterium]|nr:hypothetical protein [Patescibacteria group bacterium]
MIYMCETCQKTFEPKERNGVRTLQVFHGFTVDVRLKQFRKIEVGQELEFIDFDSSLGQELLQYMHREVCC